MRLRSVYPLTVLALAWLLGSSCGDGKKATKPEVMPPDRVPDFAIIDANPNSSSYGDTISPRIFLGKVSCWYFGHST